MYRDRFTGLYHTHFRDYDPVHSHWLSEDPAGYADGLNLNAAYMGVNGVDPLGLGVFGQIMTWLGTGGDCWPESEKADDMAYIKAIGKGAHEGKENIVSGCVDTAGSVVDCWTYGDTNYGGLDDKFVNTGTTLEVTCYENDIKGVEYYYLMTSGLLADSTFLGTIEKGVAGSEIIYGEGQLDGTRDLNLLVRTWDIAWGTTEGVLTYYGTKDLFTGVKSGKIGTESSVDDVLKSRNGGSYSYLKDHPSVGPGKNFTQIQKRKIVEENMKVNKGNVLSDQSGTQCVKPVKHTKGVTPPSNEAHIDHIVPRSQGGTNSYSNAQVLTREENLRKGTN